MAKMRVHEVAKQLSKTSKEVISALKQNGIDVQSHMSTITEESFEMVKKTFGIGREPVKEPAKEAAKKPVPARKNPQESR